MNILVFMRLTAILLSKILKYKDIRNSCRIVDEFNFKYSAELVLLEAIYSYVES